MDLLLYLVWFLLCVQTVTGNEQTYCTGNGVCYTFFRNSVSWLEAEDNCIQRNSSLVTAEESQTLPVNVLSTETEFWVGSERPTPPKWRWINEGTLIDVFNYNDSPRRTCLVLNGQGPSLSIEALPCKNKIGYICEIDYPLDCLLSGNGFEYKGRSTITPMGPCISWMAVDNPKPYWRFVDGNVDEASNYCRNVDWDKVGPWCHYLPGDGGRAYCTKIPPCMSNQKGCLESNLTRNDVFCKENKCYAVIDSSTHGSNDWLQALDCCSRMRGTLLSNISSMRDFNVIATNLMYSGSKIHEGSYWLGAINHGMDWATGGLQWGVNCPQLQVTEHNLAISTDSCGEQKPFICRYIRSSDNDVTSTPRPRSGVSDKEVNTETSTAQAATTTVPRRVTPSTSRAATKGPSHENTTQNEPVKNSDLSTNDVLGIAIGVAVPACLILIVVILLLVLFCRKRRRRADSSPTTVRRGAEAGPWKRTPHMPRANFNRSNRPDEATLTYAIPNLNLADFLRTTQKDALDSFYQNDGYTPSGGQYHTHHPTSGSDRKPDILSDPSYATISESLNHEPALPPRNYR